MVYSEEEFKEVDRLVSRVATWVINDFPYTEYEDMRQQLWVFLLDERSKGRLLDHAAQGFNHVLRWAGKAYAWQQRKQHLTITSQYAYRTSDVRKLLETLFEREEWLDATVPDDATSLRGHDGLEMSSDVAVAFGRLPLSYKQIIFKKFALRWTLDSPTDIKYLSRAVARLADILNEYQQPPPSVAHGGPGRRKPMTNAKAAVIIRREYNY